MAKIPKGSVEPTKVVHKNYLMGDTAGKGMQSSGGGIDKYPRTEMQKQQISQGNKNLVDKVNTMNPITKEKVIAQQKVNAKKRSGKKFKTY